MTSLHNDNFSFEVHQFVCDTDLGHKGRVMNTVLGLKELNMASVTNRLSFNHTL